VARDLAVEFTGLRRREFRRVLIVSAVAHGLLLLLLGAFPQGRTAVLPPGVIAVDLVAGPAAKVPSAPKPGPKRLPKPPVPKRVVLPKEPSLPKPLPKPEPKPVLPAEPPEPAQPVEEEYGDVLAQLRAEMGEDEPEQVEPSTGAAAGSAGTGAGTVSIEVAAWIRRAKIHVRRVWVLPAGFRTQQLETHVLVDLDAGGRVLGDPSISRRSGNPWYDDGVVRAIQKASPLPAPPEAGEWAFVFVPEDSY
jgi:TonB family protein